MSAAVTLESLRQRLKGCTSVLEVKQIHAQISACRPGQESRRLLGNLLVQMYGKCGSLEDAKQVFQRISSKNVYSWTIIISALAQQGRDREALQMLRRMDLEGGKAAAVTLTAVLAACCCVEEGSMIQGRIEELDPEKEDVMMQNSVMSMFSRCGCLERAVSVFRQMKRRTVFTWTIMITAFAQNGCGKEAVHCWRLMACEGCDPNAVTLVSVLRAVCEFDSAEAKRVLARITAAGLESDLLVGTALVTAHGKFGSVEDARRVFEGMEVRNKVTWNSMIAAYVQRGHAAAALELYHQMQMQEEVEDDAVTLTTILGACTSLDDGREIHAAVVKQKADTDREVCNALVHMYARCGSLEDAEEVFQRTPNRNVISWTTMIGAYASSKLLLGGRGFEAFQQMQLEGVKASEVSIVYALQSCGRAGFCAAEVLEKVRLIHREICGCLELELDAEVRNSLIGMYGECGSLGDAQAVFLEGTKNRINNLVSWTNMMVAYCDNGNPAAALGIVKRMDLEGVKLDEVALSAAVGACSWLTSAACGRELHERAVREGFAEGSVVGKALLFFYGCCGRIEEAVDVFRKLRSRDSSSFTALVGAFAGAGLMKEAGEALSEMNVEGVEAKEATFTQVFQGCSHGGFVVRGIQQFGMMYEFQGLEPTAEHYACIVDLLARSGYVTLAQEIIETMPFQRHDVPWRSLLAARFTDLLH